MQKCDPLFTKIPKKSSVHLFKLPVPFQRNTYLTILLGKYMNEFIIFFRLMDHYWYKRYVTNIHWLAIIFRKCPLWPIISKDSLTINLKQIKFLKLGKRTKNILLLMSCLTPYHVQLVLKTSKIKVEQFFQIASLVKKTSCKTAYFFQISLYSCTKI